MKYHLLGVIVAITFMITVIGLWLQLDLVIKRKKLFNHHQLKKERPTDILSLNQIGSTFFACYAFYLYGISLVPINHYLAWPRLMALILLLLLLFQVLLDRKSLVSKIMFFCAVILFLLGGLLFLIKADVVYFSKGFSQILIVVSTLVLAQGYLHQILLIRKTGRTGAVSIRFHQCLFLTAISTVAFGFEIGYKDGWPLIMLASVSAILKVITIWHFRWVRVSLKAKSLREDGGKLERNPV